MNGIFLFAQYTCIRNVNWSVTVCAVFSFPRYFQLSALLLLPKFLLSRLYISFLLQHKSRHGKIRQFNLFSLQKNIMFAIYTTNTPYIIYIDTHTHTYKYTLSRDIRLHAAEVTLLFSLKTEKLTSKTDRTIRHLLFEHLIKNFLQRNHFFFLRIFMYTFDKLTATNITNRAEQKRARSRL